jgi:hypothetical protein
MGTVWRRVPGFSDLAICRRFLPHPAFSNCCCKQRYLLQSTLGAPLRDAWVAPWATLGPPKVHPNPIPIGRGSQQRTPQVPSTKYQLPVFWLIASCYLLAARFSKTVHGTTFPLWSEFFKFTICSPLSQAKNSPRWWKVAIYDLARFPNSTICRLIGISLESRVIHTNLSLETMSLRLYNRSATLKFAN